MKGYQIDFDKDEQEARFVLWEDLSLNISMNCVYGGNTSIELNKVEADKLLFMLLESRIEQCREYIKKYDEANEHFAQE